MSEEFSNAGYCYTCDSPVTFFAQGEWLRDQYVCSRCSSIPRERALMYCIEKFFPRWRQLTVHESSPAGRGASAKLQQCCQNYIGTQYFPGFAFGAVHPSGWRNEDLEQQRFSDQSFDLVVTQDVMEHIFQPDKAFAEIARTLKPGGAHIFTVPLINKNDKSELWARQDQGGNLTFLHEPEYHGSPINTKSVPVTMHWGYDICDYIFHSSGLHTTIVYIDDLLLGIRAEYIEVLISRKFSDTWRRL